MTQIRLYIISLFCLLSSCNGKGGKQNISETGSDREVQEVLRKINSTLDEQSEQIDTQWVDKWGKTFPDNDVFYKTDSFHLFINLYQDGNGYRVEYTPRNSFFSVVKYFYSSGIIKEKGLTFYRSGWFREGIWYTYDQAGRLNKLIDYNSDYPYSFEKIIDFCKEENIPLNKSLLGTSWER